MTFQGDDIAGEGTVLNISRGGWKVRSMQSLPAGIYLSLHVRLPDNLPPLDVDLTAVRGSQGDEFGLEIIRIKTDEWRRFWRVTDTLAADLKPADSQ